MGRFGDALGRRGFGVCLLFKGFVVKGDFFDPHRHAALVKIRELDFPLELQEKLLNVGVDTLEKLINLKYLHFLNMREIAILREKLYALGLQDDRKILVMSKEAINKKYTEQLLKIYSSREEINRLELENRGYEMILKLERGKFGDE